MYNNRFYNPFVSKINTRVVNSEMNRGTIPFDEKAFIAEHQKEKDPPMKFKDPIQVTQDGEEHRIENSIYPDLYSNYMNSLKDYSERYDAWKNYVSMAAANQKDITSMQKFHEYANKMMLININQMYLSRIQNAIYAYYYSTKEAIMYEMYNHFNMRYVAVIDRDSVILNRFITPVIDMIEYSLSSVRFKDIRYTNTTAMNDFNSVVLFTISSTLTGFVNAVYDAIVSCIILPNVYVADVDDDWTPEGDSRSKDLIYGALCNSLSIKLRDRYDSMVLEINEVLGAIRDQAAHIQQLKLSLIEIVDNEF